MSSKLSEVNKTNEFKPDADKLTDPITRRHFLKIMGASVALAGVAGCTPLRKPVQYIRPYAKRPEHVLPGKLTYYATSMAIGNHVMDMLGATY